MKMIAKSKINAALNSSRRALIKEINAIGAIKNNPAVKSKTSPSIKVELNDWASSRSLEVATIAARSAD